MPINKHKKTLSILLLVVFVVPFVSRSLHFGLIAHDFFPKNEKRIAFHHDGSDFCAYHQDLFNEFFNNHQVFYLLHLENDNQIYLDYHSQVYTTPLYLLSARAPPLMLRSTFKYTQKFILKF